MRPVVIPRSAEAWHGLAAPRWSHRPPAPGPRRRAVRSPAPPARRHRTAHGASPAGARRRGRGDRRHRPAAHAPPPVRPPLPRAPRVYVGGVHSGAREASGHERGDRCGARAQLEHSPCGQLPRGPQGLGDEQRGAPTGHEHARRDGEPLPQDIDLADDVLEELPGHAPARHLLELGGIVAARRSSAASSSAKTQPAARRRAVVLSRVAVPIWPIREVSAIRSRQCQARRGRTAVACPSAVVSDSRWCRRPGRGSLDSCSR